jgi:hypothetical protein
MAIYLISYDLNKPGQDYADLIAAIKRLGTWWHYLDSTWVVEHDGPAMTIRDALFPNLDRNDELLVVRLGKDWAWYGRTDAGQWLQRNL